MTGIGGCLRSIHRRDRYQLLDLVERCASVLGGWTLFPLEIEDISDHVIRVGAGKYKIGH